MRESIIFSVADQEKLIFARKSCASCASLALFSETNVRTNWEPTE